MVRIRSQNYPDATRETHLVTFPAEFSYKAVLAFTDALGALEKPRPLRPLHAVAFEVYKDSDGFKFLFSIPPHVVAAVDAYLRTHIPGSRLTLLDDDMLPKIKWDVVAEYGSAARDKNLHIPLGVGKAHSILASFTDPKPGEAAMMQLIIASAPRRNPEDNEKYNGQVFYTSLRLAAKGKGASTRLRQIYGAIASSNTHEMKLRRVWWIPTSMVKDRVSRRVSPLGFSLVLSDAELASLLAFPMEKPNVSGLPVGKSRHLAADRSIPNKGIAVGLSNYPGDEDRVLAVTPEQLTKHAHILGPQGSGKTTTAINMMVQAMDQGLGVTFIDPHGDAAKLLLNCVPKHRLDDVIWFNPIETDRSIGLNMLDGDPYDATENVMSVFNKLFEIHKMAQTSDMLHNGVLTLARNNMTLMELPLLFGVSPESKAFRERIVPTVTHEASIREFWHGYNALSTAQKVNAAQPVLRRIRKFDARPTLRACLGQTGKGLDFDDILKNRKILIASLSKGQLKEEPAKLFGSFLVSRLWDAVLGLANIDESQRQPHLVFIDEFSNYTNIPMDFGEALAEARKYKTGFILLHQHLRQLPPHLRDSLAPNTATKIAWKLAYDDAAVMSRELGNITTPVDHQMLEDYEVIIKFPGVTRPATAMAVGPVEQTKLGEEAKRISGMKYGRTIEEVEAEMQARQGEKKTRKPPKIGWVPDA